MVHQARRFLHLFGCSLCKEVIFWHSFFLQSPSPRVTGERSQEGGSLSSSHFAFQVKYYGNDDDADDYKNRNE